MDMKLFEKFLDEVYGISWGYFDNNFEGSYLDEAYERYDEWLREYKPCGCRELEKSDSWTISRIGESSVRVVYSKRTRGYMLEHENLGDEHTMSRAYPIERCPFCGEELWKYAINREEKKETA